MKKQIPTYQDIKDAHRRIRAYAHQTPVMSSSLIDRRANCHIFFKCENFQRVGAFKFRGAMNAMLQLEPKTAGKRVATHSSGNHAQAVALSAKILKMPATIVMPENSPAVKINAVRDYGADIRFCESNLNARETTLQQVIEETGAHFIHPYNDVRIIAGQGTAALELLESQPHLDIIMAPVGGGGLMSGTSIAAKGHHQKIMTIGAEPELADDAYRSFKAGKLIPLKHTETIADGLRTSLGSLTFKAIQTYTDDIVTVSEGAIVDAMRYIWERMKIIIEPSCAVPLAAIFENKIEVSGKKVGIILSGGNVDLDKLPWN